MNQGKTLKVLAGLALLVGFAFNAPAEASSLTCKNGQLALKRDNVYYKAADDAAALHAFFGDITIKKAGPIQKPRLIQQCTNKARNFEGIAVNFQVVAKSPRGAAKTYLCLTKQKRYIDHTGGWSRWFNVETLCRVGKMPVHRGRVEQDRGYGNGSGGAVDNGMPVGPDEVYDPDFYRDEPDYGPDSYYDGSTPRGRGEFDDIQF